MTDHPIPADAPFDSAVVVHEDGSIDGYIYRGTGANSITLASITINDPLELYGPGAKEFVDDWARKTLHRLANGEVTV